MKTTKQCDDGLNAISGIVDRLLIAASYSALRQGTIILTNVVLTVGTRDIFQLVCTFLFFLIAIKFKTLEGIQNLLVMVTAGGFSAAMPLPQEPSGFLVLPAVLVYFAMSALVMEYAYRFGLIRDEKDTATSKTIQYIVLFVGARGLARFQAIEQVGILGVISLVYLLLPLNIPYKTNSTLDFFLQIVDCLANRGVVVWLIRGIETFTGVSSLFPNIYFYVGVLMWNPLGKAPKLSTCAGVFTFFTARQIVRVLQTRLSDAVCGLLLCGILTCMIISGDGSSPVFTMIMFGSGVIFTNWLEKWIKNWSQHSDWMIVYLVVFVGLEALNRLVKGKISNNQSADKSKTTMIEASVLSGIAHQHALLGLPHVDDLAGNH
jgi:hypothetical protein